MTAAGSEENPSRLAALRHDLRTPLNHIIGYSELLAEDLAERGVTDTEDLGKVQAAAQQLVKLIETRLADANFGDISAPVSEAIAPDYKKAVAALAAETGPYTEHLSTVTGRILIVDDDPGNRAVLAQRLERQGHQTAEASDGLQALEMMAANPYDLVLLDVMMLGMDGYAALGRMKADPATRHIPVIMISALDEIASVVRCIETGAEDFLPKPFNPTLLRARIGASLEKKHFRDQEQAYLGKIEETQLRLKDELQEAAKYVASILPAPMDAPFSIAWAYHPSTELGGDSFGYHWLDDTHFAIYLLDVCGHGVGAALLSVAAINVLRFSSLKNVDFQDPADVLAGLNDTFQMELHNNMYFTIWYGVYHTPSRNLSYASGGHPPSLLFDPATGTNQTLPATGMLIGAMPGMTFKSHSCVVPPGSRLLIYCDGAYEIKRPDGTMIDYDEDFLPFLSEHGRSKTLPDDVLKWIRSVHVAPDLEDDYSFVTVDFPVEE